MVTEADLWRHVKEDASFRILVWGPGEGSPFYHVRLAIREALRGVFARVEFSEDIVTPSTGRSNWLDSLAIQERLQALGANLVYLLASSPGAKLELILFWKYANIGPKLHVLTAEDLDDGSFLGRVTSDIVSRMPRHHVHSFPTITAPALADFCVDHARQWYVGTHPEGPPNLGIP